MYTPLVVIVANPRSFALSDVEVEQMDKLVHV